MPESFQNSHRAALLHFCMGLSLSAAYQHFFATRVMAALLSYRTCVVLYTAGHSKESRVIACVYIRDTLQQAESARDN